MLGTATLLATLLVGPVQAAAGGHVVETPSSSLVPSVELGLGYHSNVWHAPTGAVGAPSLLVHPSLEARRHREDWSLDLDADYDLRLYTPGTELFAHSRWMDGAVALDLDVREGRGVGFELEADAAVDDPQEVPAHTRLRGGLAPRVVLRPASAIELRLGGTLAGEEHRGPWDLASSSALGPRLEAGPTWEARWRFFPRTALIVQGGYLLEQRVGSTGTLFDLWGGLRGRLTPRLTMALLAGYGSARVNGVPLLGGVQRLLIQARIDADLRAGTASLSYRKDHADPHISELVTFHRLDGRIAAQPWGRLGWELALTGAGEAYLGSVTRADLLLMARPGLSWQLSRRLSASAGGGWVMRASSDPSASFTDLELRAGVTAEW